jgi:hypothetical protein
MNRLIFDSPRYGVTVFVARGKRAKEMRDCWAASTDSECHSTRDLEDLLAEAVAARDASEANARRLGEHLNQADTWRADLERKLIAAVAARDEARRERETVRKFLAITLEERDKERAWGEAAEASRDIAVEALERLADPQTWKLGDPAPYEVARAALVELEPGRDEGVNNGLTERKLAVEAALVELNPTEKEAMPVTYYPPPTEESTAEPTVTSGDPGSDTGPLAVELNPDGLSEPGDTNSETGDNPRGESHAGTRQPDSLNGPSGTLNPASDPESPASLSPSSEVAAEAAPGSGGTGADLGGTA